LLLASESQNPGANLIDYYSYSNLDETLFPFTFVITNCNKENSSTSQGQAIFWTLTFSYGNFPGPKTIYVEDNLVGTSSTGYSNSPTCTASGCVVFKADPGTYNWKAVVPDHTNVYITGTVTITSGGCVAVDVTI